MILTSDNEYVPTFGADEEDVVLYLEDTDDGDDDNDGDDDENGLIELPNSRTFGNTRRLKRVELRTKSMRDGFDTGVTRIFVFGTPPRRFIVLLRL
jgi:hypothetical protein